MHLSWTQRGEWDRNTAVSGSSPEKIPHCVLLPPASRIIAPKIDAHLLALQRVENYFWKRSTIEFAPFYFNLFSSSKTLQNAWLVFFFPSHFVVEHSISYNLLSLVLGASQRYSSVDFSGTRGPTTLQFWVLGATRHGLTLAFGPFLRTRKTFLHERSNLKNVRLISRSRKA